MLQLKNAKAYREISVLVSADINRVNGVRLLSTQTHPLALFTYWSGTFMLKLCKLQTLPHTTFFQLVYTRFITWSIIYVTPALYSLTSSILTYAPSKALMLTASEPPSCSSAVFYWHQYRTPMSSNPSTE